MDFFAPIAYWVRVFASAAQSSYHAVIGQPFPALALAIVVYAASAVAHGRIYGRDAMTEDFVRPAVAGIVGVVFAGFLVFVYFLLVTPSRVNQADRERAAKVATDLTAVAGRVTELEAKLERSEARVAELVGSLPGIQLTPEQSSRFVASLRALGRHDLKMFYLDTPTSGASAAYVRLVDWFREAGWHVEVQRATWPGSENAEGLAMHVESTSHISPLQRGVLSALKDAEIIYGFGGGGRSRVEPHEVILIAGNQRR